MATAGVPDRVRPGKGLSFIQLLSVECIAVICGCGQPGPVHPPRIPRPPHALHVLRTVPLSAPSPGREPTRTPPTVDQAGPGLDRGRSP